MRKIGAEYVKWQNESNTKTRRLAMPSSENGTQGCHRNYRTKCEGRWAITNPVMCSRPKDISM